MYVSTRVTVYIYFMFVYPFSAYEVLSDEDKRKQYDRLGANAYENQGARGGGGGGGGRPTDNFNFKEFYRGFDSSFHQRRSQEGHKRGHKQKFGNFDFDSFWNDFDDDKMFANMGGFDGFGNQRFGGFKDQGFGGFDSAFANGHFGNGHFSAHQQVSFKGF